MRDALMGLQVALAVLVLVAAALFYRSFAQTQVADPGFRTEGVVLAAYNLTGKSTADGFGREFASRLLARLRAVAGVESAAISTSVPLDIHGLPLRSFTVEGRATTSDAPETALMNTVTPDYFTAIGVALVEGPGLRRSGRSIDAAAGGRQRGVCPPLRHRRSGRPPDHQPRSPVRHRRHRAHVDLRSVRRGANAGVLFLVSRPLADAGEIHLRVRPGTEAVMASEIQRVVRELDASLPVYNIRTMTEHIDKNLFMRKIPARMFIVIGPLLLALVAIGIYAVVSYAVSLRTSEIGLRLALGATSRTVVAQIVREGLKVIAFGAFCGWLIALMVDLHLFSGGTDDLLPMIGVPVVLLAIATLACWMPANRAAKIDPLKALRTE